MTDCKKTEKVGFVVMKRMVGLLGTAVTAIALIAGLSACGNANAEKQKKLDELMTQYEGVVAQAQAEMDKLTGYVQSYEIESFDEQYEQIKETVESYAAQKDEIVDSYKENKDAYDAAKLDELIALMQEYISKGTTFVDSLKTTVANVEEVIAQAGDGE